MLGNRCRVSEGELNQVLRTARVLETERSEDELRLHLLAGAPSL